MNDIQRIEGRLFKYYSIVADGSELTPDQISHFLELRPYPGFPKNVTIEHFQKVLFGPGAKISYVFEDFDSDVPGQARLATYQFSPVYAGRIALAEDHWKKKARAEKVLGDKRLENAVVEHSEQSLSTAEDHRLEVERARQSGYLAGQTRGVLTGVREAIDYMREYEKLNSRAQKYGPGLIGDVEKWLLEAEAGPSGTPVDIENLILQIVEKFTKRNSVAERFKNAVSDGADLLME